MNTARRLPIIKTSNPASVLKTISAIQGHVVEHVTDHKTHTSNLGWVLPIVKSEPERKAKLVRSNVQDQAPAIRLRIDPSTTMPESVVDNVLETCVESAEQIQQLARLLMENKAQLKQRESDLNSRIEDWELKVKVQQDRIKLKLNQLEQQSAQVRCQQLHLMQLQSDIVKSHEASKAAIETLVTAAGTDQQTIATLKALKHQISGRFDFIARRWEHLSRIMHNQRDQHTLQSGSDLVDWTGEFQ